MRAVVKDGKVDGKPIIRAWESFTHWLWLATEQVTSDLYFGLVIGFETEWGYFSLKELENVGPMVWEVRKQDIPLIEREAD